MKWPYLFALLGFFPLCGADQLPSNESLKSVQELLKEQRLEDSITAYLSILEAQKKIDSPLPESEKFHQAYKIYINLQGRSSQETAAEILQKFGTTTDDPSLAYLLAASYANLGRFECFFPLFLAAYINDPNHYLADKMKAVLHIKLYERLLPGKQKEDERAKILQNLQTALTKNPSDHMLYKMMIAFSSDADKPKQIEASMNMMMKENVVYPRADLLFYVRMALAVGNRPLAQSFIDYSRGLFGYSRSLEAAQRILDSKEL